MALTKPQKKYILNNYKVLTCKEISDKLRVKVEDIENYLKQNKRKPLITVDDLKHNTLLQKEREVLVESNRELEPEEKDISFLKIIKKNLKFILILCLGISVLYFNSLAGDFVSDDYATIPQNPLINDFVFMAKDTLPKFTNYLINMVAGVSNPVPYHLFNLIVYLGVCVTAFVLLSMVFDGFITKLAIVIFAVHPIHVESVSWISGKPYSLVSLFLLLSLAYLVLFLKTKNKKNLLYLTLYLVLSFYSDKVRSISFILISIILFISFQDKLRLKKEFVKRTFIYGCIGVVILLVLLSPFIIDRVNTVNAGYNGSGSNFYNPFFQYPTAITKYLQLLFLPTDLTLYHTMYILPAWFNWMVMLTYLIGLIYFFFKDKRYFFALAFIFAATAPSMAPVKVSWLVAERYVFLGSLGFCLFLALILEKFKEKHTYILTISLAVILSFYSIRTFLRNIDWQTNHKLWVNTVQVSPNSHNAWNNIGDDYDKLAQYDHAIKGFTQSTVVKPDYADAYHNRANIFYKVGRLDMARESYNIALSYAPGLFQTYFSLVQIDIIEKKYDLALEHAKTVVQIQPNIAQSHYVLAVVLAQIGDIENSKKELLISNQIDPRFTPASDLLKTLESQKT